LAAPPGLVERSITTLFRLAVAITASLRRAALDIARAGNHPTGSVIAKSVTVERRGGQPLRPGPRANMTAEQWLDFLAACDGKISWAWYHAKWRLALSEKPPDHHR
jgi:hypothetical protein